MGLAERSSSLGIEALTFQVLLAVSAVEALAVVVIAKGLYPAVSGLNWETTSKALGREQLVPICLTVWQSIFQEEWIVAKQLATVSTQEAFWVEMLANCIQAISFDLLAALVARGSQVLLKAVFTIQLTLLFHEANVSKRATALGVHTDEMIWAPVLAKCSNEGAPDLCIAVSAQGDPTARNRALLGQHTPSPARGC